MTQWKAVARDLIHTMGISGAIRHLYFEETDSPWNEKAFIKRKREYLDVKVTVWTSNAFLFGRLYHLFLYICDVLNPAFLYDPAKAPEEDREPEIRDIYNQVWSIFVDSRIERLGIENFYDRILRRNLFVDAVRDPSRLHAETLFQALWEKEFYTYPEIINFAYRIPPEVCESVGGDDSTSRIELLKSLRGCPVGRHLEKLPSEELKGKANELLNFTAYYCKDALIISSYFGISVIYQRKVLLEMIPTTTNLLFLTFLDAASGSYATSVIDEGTDIEEVEQTIKEMYKRASFHGQAM